VKTCSGRGGHVHVLPVAMALLQQIPADLKMGREYSLLGNYDRALVYFEGVTQSIKQLIDQSTGPNRAKWQAVSARVGCIPCAPFSPSLIAPPPPYSRLGVV